MERTFNKTGNFKPFTKLQIANYLEALAEQSAIIGKDAAAKDMLNKKQASPKMPSPLFNSFAYKIKQDGNIKAVGTFTAGNENANYAIYVDQPRQSFSGYFFMLAGHKEVERQMPALRKKLAKIYLK